jgi:hypothetical protein
VSARGLLLVALLAGCGNAGPQENSPESPVGTQATGVVPGVNFTMRGWLHKDLTILDDPNASFLRLTDRFSAPRVACVLVNNVDGGSSGGTKFVMTATETYGEVNGSGIFVKVDLFDGPGKYAITNPGGRVWAYADAHLQACTRAHDRLCYGGADGCTLTVDTLDFTPGIVAPIPGLPKGVRFGIGKGHVSCPQLQNPTTLKNIHVEADFTCRAQDWTPVGG